uniref:Uncharacterized protein n=1 Tax=Glycine max TaxID=3847 RepID=A0A0R0KNP3_SOYBN
MAWDLWSSSYAQVASGSNYWSQHPECDFYFGCGRDFIEEDALNVESCVRVLRILITKADTEIEELERDLLLLQNELACTEHEKWPDICCAALTERISRLDVAVSTLKNDYADDAEMQPLLDKEPAETLNEILAQSLDMNMLSPIVNVTGHALDKDSSTFDSNIIIKEEEKELHGTSESSELLLELHEKRSDNPEKIEKENEFVKENDVSLDDFRPAIGVKGRKEYPHSRLATSQQRKRGPDHSHWMKLSETSDNKVAGNEEVGRNQLINTDIGQILDLFSAKDNENIPSEVKKESEFVKEKDVSSDDFRPAIGVKGRKEYPHSRLATSQQQKSGPESPDHSDWMKLSETSDKVSGNEVERSQLIDTDIGQILDLFSAKDNENIPNEAKVKKMNLSKKMLAQMILDLQLTSRGGKSILIPD